MKIRPQIVVVAVCALLSTACSTDEGQPIGSPLEPSITNEPTSIPQQPGEIPPSAPKVANPITDLERFKQSPCAMVSDEDAKSLGFRDEHPRPDAPNGPSCIWRNDNLENFGIGLLNGQPLGIAGIYRNQQKYDMYKYFEPVEIAGYPGLFSDISDGRAKGACTLSVGVTDNQVFTVTTQVKRDACEFARSAAEAALTTMSKG